MRSSEISHFTFTQLNKELHYRHGDTRTHLQRHSPLLEVPSSMAAENGERAACARDSKIIFEFTSVEFVCVRVCVCVQESHFLLNTTVGCFAIATGSLFTFTKLADET